MVGLTRSYDMPNALSGIVIVSLVYSCAYAHMRMKSCAYAHMRMDVVHFARHSIAA